MTTRLHPRTLTEAAVLAVIGRLRHGSLSVEIPGREPVVLHGREPGPTASVRLDSPAAARRMLLGGGMGFSEGYIEGDWSTDDLPALLDVGTANMHLLPGLPTPLRPLHRRWHAMRDNDRTGARKNIAEHYDLGNDFYELWLDDTMTYSCSLDPQPDEPLECAQRRKWDRLLDLLQPTRADHILEIGCGWGGFALHAAQEAGCRVTGITLSEEQKAMAEKRVREHGLEGRVHIALEDYRDVAGSFSAIASIEMFEAVGEKWWPTYFRRIKELLPPGGGAAIQTITIAENSFEEYRSQPDFIQRYVFPGGMLPSPERFSGVTRDAGLTMGEPLFFGADYARTLRLWRERFDAVTPAVAALGFDERFIRLWRFYLEYCRAGFDNGNIDVMQVRLEA